MKRTLAPEEAALWKRVIATVKPLKAAKPAAKPPAKSASVTPSPLPAREGQGVGASGKAASPTPAAKPTKASGAKPLAFPGSSALPRATKESFGRADARTHPQPLPKREGLDATLDASWDRRLSRGLVAPESRIDLHGHSLSAAYDRLDYGLEQAIRHGDRVLLLITGKAPRPESERPHARGAIRAAVGDWLAASRHADRIAAVRGAHPRHGGSGALYIVLRRPKAPSPRNS